MPEPRRLSWIAVSLLGCVALAVLLTLVRDRAGETPVYRKAALRAMRGEQFYQPEDHPAFTYPPFFVLAYAPLAPLPDVAGRVAWYCINFLLLAGIAHLTWRLTCPVMVDANSKLRRATTCLVVTGLSARFVISPIEYQGHDLLVYFLAMLAIYCWAAERDARAGSWAGLAAACKATPLLFLVGFVRQLRTRAVIALVAAACVATLLPDLLFSNPDGQLWAVTWYQKFVSKVSAGAPADAAGVWVSWNMLNQSLSGTMYRLTTAVATPSQFCWDVSLIDLGPAARKGVTLLAQISVVGWLAYVTQPRWLSNVALGERMFRVLGQGGCVLCGMLLLSPMSSKQHFCFLLAPISFLVVDYFYRGRSLSSGGALLVILLLGTLTGKDVCGEALHMQLAAYGNLTWCTLTALVASGLVLRRRAHLGWNSVSTDPVFLPTRDLRCAA